MLEIAFQEKKSIQNIKKIRQDMSLVIQEPHRYKAKHRHDELDPAKSNPEESKSDPARVWVHTCSATEHASKSGR